MTTRETDVDWSVRSTCGKHTYLRQKKDTAKDLLLSTTALEQSHKRSSDSFPPVPGATTMVWPLDLFPSSNVSLNRRLWNVCKLPIFLLLLLLVSIHVSDFFLRRANGFGRNCLPLAGEDEYEMETKIAIVSFLDEGGRGKVVSQRELFGRKWAPPARTFEGLMEIVKSNKEEYARRWGYDFIDARNSVDRSRPASWSKIPAVRSHLDRYDWIFWNDADSLVTNPNISLERILQSVLGHSNPDQYPDLIVTEDVNGVNAGMFFVRRSKWSEEFLGSWWNMSSFIIRGSKRSGDNAALIHHIKSLSPSEMQRHVRVTEMQCIFNSYLWIPTWKSFYRLIVSPSASWKGAYSDGDFVVHLAGLDDKTGWAAQILHEIQLPPSREHGEGEWRLGKKNLSMVLDPKLGMILVKYVTNVYRSPSSTVQRIARGFVDYNFTSTSLSYRF